MEFGLIKSKIEKKLINAYVNNKFSKEIMNFNRFVLENKKICNLYYIYDELSKKKGLTESVAREYIDECVKLVDNLKINQSSLTDVMKWVMNTPAVNKYSHIDSILNKNTFIIENKINAKHRVIKILCESEQEFKSLNLPHDKVVLSAKNSLEGYLSSLSESELKEIKLLRSLNESEITSAYIILSEIAINKLSKLSESSDFETKSKITETISKIKEETPDVISLYRLKILNSEI